MESGPLGAAATPRCAGLASLDDGLNLLDGLAVKFARSGAITLHMIGPQVVTEGRSMAVSVHSIIGILNTY